MTHSAPELLGQVRREGSYQDDQWCHLGQNGFPSPRPDSIQVLHHGCDGRVVLEVRELV